MSDAMTAFNTGIALSAQASANAAEEEAKRARIAACTSVLATYQSKAAGIAEMRTYADCVYLVHPENRALTHDQIITVKVIIISAIIGAFVGMLRGSGDRFDRFETMFGLGLLGAALGLLLPMVLFLIYSSIAFLFS